MSQYKMRNTCDYQDYDVLAYFEEDDRIFADIQRKNSVGSKIEAYLVMINPGSCAELEITHWK